MAAEKKKKNAVKKKVTKKKVAKKKAPVEVKRDGAGRPSIYSKELVAKICERIVVGDSIRTISACETMPCMATIFLWLSKYPEFLEQYRVAKEQQANVFSEELIEIADDGRNDYYLKQTKDGDVFVALDAENINRSRLRINTRQWVMERMQPKVYGQKQTTEHTFDFDEMVKALDRAKARARKARSEQ